MTTTIRLPIRDCIVIGCDSLATTPAPYLNPHLVLSTFFEESGALKIDQDGTRLGSLFWLMQLSGRIRPEADSPESCVV